MAPRALTLLLAGFLMVAAAEAASAPGSCIAVDDLSKGKIGEFPPDWKARKDAGKAVYSVREENGLRFLRAASRGLGIQAARGFEWDLNAYPILEWSWRPIKFPAGSDERNSKTADSVLAVYAVFPHTMVSLKAVKYIWSAVVPVGTRLTSNMGLTQVKVIRTGVPERPEWVEERANVLEDYRTLFGDAEPSKPVGVAVLTDSDDTGSSAEGDYASFRVCKP